MFCVANMTLPVLEEPARRAHRFYGVFRAITEPHGTGATLEVHTTQADGSSMHPSQTDDLRVLLHGEILGEAALRRDLGIVEDASVAAVLTAAWRRWGIDTFRRLSGNHAIIVRDGNHLYAYRNRIGTHTLYLYVGLSNAVAFASHLPDLWSIPGVEARTDRQSLHEYLRFLDIAPPHTWYQDVVAVGTGEVLRWSVSTRHLSAIPISMACDESSCLVEAVETLDALLGRSVDKCLEGSFNPACFLSGGMDSSLLCAIAARLRPDTAAISVGFAGSSVDESSSAARIATHLKLRHEILNFSQAQYEHALQNLGCTADQPMADPAVLPTMLAFQHCSGRFDVAIDGSGADEAFGLMPPRHVRIGVEYAARIPTSWRRTLVRAVRSVRRFAPYAAIADFDHPVEMTIRWRGFSQRQIEELCSEPVSLERASFYQVFERFPPKAHFERYSALLDAMPCDRLTQAAQISGLRVRFPFADPSVDHFVRSLPISLRYHTGEPKRALRHVLDRYLPRALWDAPKHGFTFPLWDFLAANDFAVVRRYLGCADMFAPLMLARHVVQDLLNRVIAGDRDSAFRAWALVILGSWLEGHATPISEDA